MLSLGFLRSCGTSIGNICYLSGLCSRQAQQQINNAYSAARLSYVTLKPQRCHYVFEITHRGLALNSGLVRPYHRGECIGLLNKRITVNLSIREKHSKKKGKQSRSTTNDEFTDDDLSDEDIELKSGSDFKESLFKLDTLRMDSVIHVGFGMSRNKVDTAFYKRNILVNGKRPQKKSVNLHDGDEIDIIKGSKPENPDFVNVSRIVIDIINYNEDTGKLSVRLRKYNQLLIENPDEAAFERD